MPIFYFHLRGDDYEVPDLAGRKCAHDGIARREAEALAVELIEAARAAGDPPPTGTIEVVDEEMRPILTLPLGRPAG